MIAQPLVRTSLIARRGLGLIELLTIVALLIVGLALVVATARHVRSSSANELTRKRLQALVDEAGRLVLRDGLDPTLPLPAGIDAVGDADLARVETLLQQFARDSSDHLADLRGRVLAAAAKPGPPVRFDAGQSARPPYNSAGAIGSALLGTTGGSERRDAWGRPIALIPRQLPAVGIAPDNGPFFVSAGPDGRFLTLSDNLYSYDLPALLPPLADPPPPRLVARRPATLPSIRE